MDNSDEKTGKKNYSRVSLPKQGASTDGKSARNKVSRKMAHKKGRRGISYLRSQALLLCTLAKVVLASVVGVVSVIQDLYVPMEGGVAIELKQKSKKLTMGSGS